jgi:aromatic-L-amino-acid decarboxylase
LHIVEIHVVRFVVATIGTTSSGAVDRLDEISEVSAYTDRVLASLDESSFLHAAKHYPFLWLHVDAAWAGVAFVCPEYREACQLPAVNDYADSFCTNFHKVCSYLIVLAQSLKY